MSAEVALGEVDSIRIDLPEVWTTIPIESNDTINKMLTEHRDERQWALLSVTEQRRAELFTQQLDAYLAQGRVAFVSYFCEIEEPGVQPGEQDPEASPSSVEQSSETNDPYVVLGAVTVSLLSNADLGTDARLSADLLQAAMATEGSDEATKLLEVPEKVELPAGEAVVVRRSLRLGGTGSPLSFNESYLVPVPPARESVCVVSFVSPNIELAGEFSELADAIARTLRFYRSGEETLL